jgi:hypothetical protein
MTAQQIKQNNADNISIVQKQENELLNADDDLKEEYRTNKNETLEQQDRITSTTEKARATVAIHDSKKSSSNSGVTGSKSPEFTFVPLSMSGNSGRTHAVSEGSRRIMKDENVTVEKLQFMTELFYDKTFVDKTLDQFIRSHKDPHGSRFAKWIHQKLTGSDVWDVDRQEIRDLKPVRLAGGYSHVVHDRSSAHVAAWYSPKRPTHEVGRHFTLEECRVWMRLHFWALRESRLLEQAPSFADYYVRFIGHFIRVYESTAPVFTRDSFRWSANPSNIETYLSNGNCMVDVIGQNQQEAEAQLPEEELNDFEWPYNQTPSQQVR